MPSDNVPDADVGWRQGRKQPQNLYLNGRYVAVAFNPHVAAQMCRALNRELDRAAEAAVQARARLDAEIKGHALDAERRGEAPAPAQTDGLSARTAMSGWSAAWAERDARGPL